MIELKVMIGNAQKEAMIYTDDEINKLWQTRCNNCLAACCFFSIWGYESIGKDMDDDMSFFTYDFVIMEYGRPGLQICPLNVLGKCLIYNDRPSICKFFKCFFVFKDQEMNI